MPIGMSKLFKVWDSSFSKVLKEYSFCHVKVWDWIKCIGLNIWYNFSLYLFRWFKHFYVFATFWSTFSLGLLVNVYFLGGEVPQIITNFLDILGSSHRRAGGKWC